MEAVFRHLLPAMMLGVGTVVCSLLGPPCMSPLGLQLDVNDYSLTFDIAVSSGDVSNIRLNGPKSWRPPDINGSFLEINISQSVLLTGLQVQGDPQQTGQIIGWMLDTSQDCETYRTENYSLDPLSPVHTQTVHLRSIGFVSCIRLRPTQFKGKSPDLRLELLGCVIEDSSVCGRDVHPVVEIWMESGGRQLNFLHEIVISWIKILLELKADGDIGDAGIFYSKSCDQWQYYEPADTSVISVTSPDQTSSWMTIDMDKPIRARCLRVFPPFATALKEVHTSGCSSHVTTNLHEVPRNKTSMYDTDISAYQKDGPDVPNKDKAGGKEAAKQMLDQQKDKSSSPEASRADVKWSQKQQLAVDKATASARIVSGDSDVQVARTSEELAATSTITSLKVVEDTTIPSQILNEIITQGNSLAEPAQPSVAANVTTLLYDTENVRQNVSTPLYNTENARQNVSTPLYNTENERQNVTQQDEDNDMVTRLSNLHDNTAAEKKPFMNKTMSSDKPATVVVTDAEQSTILSVTKSDNNISENRKNGNTSRGSESGSNGRADGLLEKPTDTSSNSAETVQDSASTASISNLDRGKTVTHQSENDSSSTGSEKETSSIQSENSSSIIHSENRRSDIHSENNSSTSNSENDSSVIHSENNAVIIQSENDALAIHSENVSSAIHSENYSSVIHPENDSSVIHPENDSPIIHSEKDISAIHSENYSSVIHPENDSSVIHSEKDISAVQSMNDSSVIHDENDDSSAIHPENDSSIIHSENDSSVTHSEKDSSAIHSENDNSLIHPENDSPIIHSENDRSVIHPENDSSVIHSENDTSVIHSEDDNSAIHSESHNASTRPEINRSDTNGWWRTNCGVKAGAKGYRKKRVISGQRNIPGEWPWLTSMHFLPWNNFTNRSGFNHLCGASLIAPRWLLSAAHCFSDLVHDGLSNVSSWRVYFGMHDLAREDNQDFVQERLIEEIYIYPKYNITDPLIYDIALVKLSQPVEYSQRVSPVCLDTTDMRYEEIPCRVSGWGQLSTDSPGSRFPYTASLSTLSLAVCKSKYDILEPGHAMKPYIRMEPPVLCGRVGASGEDACQGDSGGPLMCRHDGRWYQAGVVAAGYLCGHEATPGLYSRISYYFDWIHQTITDNDGT
ncbi:hypothetical protein BsWGS_20652 [Bradybaena similaris]